MIPQQPGRCLLFDGVNDAVIADGLSWGLAYPFTLSCWFNASTISAAQDLVTVCDPSVANQYFGIAVNSSNAIIATRCNTTSSPLSVTTTAFVATDKWHHVAVVFVNATTVRAYVDGFEQLNTSGATSVTAPDSSFTRMAIGALYHSTPTQYANAKIFDVRLYSAALTAAEVAAMYRATMQPGGDVAGTLYPTNLDGHWKLDEGGATNYSTDYGWSLDSSGNEHHGVLMGASTAFDYEGSDVPCSFQNELGFSDQTSKAGWTSMWTDADIVSWTSGGTDGKATALSNQSWAGRTGLYAAKFDDTALGGGANNQVIAGANGFTYSANRLYKMTMDVALSRELATGEELMFRLTPTMATIKLRDTASVTDYSGIARQREWQTVTSLTESNSGTGTAKFLILPVSNITGGDLTIYIDNVTIHDIGSGTAGGDLDNKQWPERIPASSANTAQDVFGNALTYAPSVKRDAVLKASPCVTLDGTNDYLDTSTFTDKTNMSVTAWVYRAAGTIGGIYSNYDYLSSQRGIEFYFAATGELQCNISPDGGNTSLKLYTSQASVPLDTWTHVAVTFAPNDLKAYINGRPEVFGGTRDDTVNTINGSTNTALIGARYDNGAKASYLNGRMADVRVYDRTLSAAEVQLISDGKRGHTSGNDPNIGWWPMCEGSGTTVYDASGNANNATMSGMTSAEAWANTQDVYHHAVQFGFWGADLTGKTFDGTSHGMQHETGKTGLIPSGTSFWAAVWFTLADTDSVQGLFAKHDTAANERSYLLFASSTTLYARVSTTGANDITASRSSGVAASSQMLALLHFNAGTQELHLYSSNTASWTAPTAVGSADVHSNPDVPMTIGCWMGSGTPGSFVAADIAMAAMGSGQSLTKEQIQTLLYNSGTPPTYSSLSASDKTNLGLRHWYDLNDFGNTVTDQHGTADMVAVSGATFDDHPVPQYPVTQASTTNHAAGAQLGPVLSAIDFSGGVSAPWSSDLNDGYYACDGTVSGFNVDDTIVGNVSSTMTCYTRVRNVDSVSTNRILLGAQSATINVDRWEFLYIVGDTREVRLWDNGSPGSTGVTIPDDGEWHDVMVTINGTTAQFFVDGSLELTDNAVSNLSSNSGNWTKAIALAAAASNSSNVFKGDVSRIMASNQVLTYAQATSDTPPGVLLDLRFDADRIYDVAGGIEPVDSQSGRAQATAVVPSGYQYGDAVPEGMTKVRT